MTTLRRLLYPLRKNAEDDRTPRRTASPHGRAQAARAPRRCGALPPSQRLVRRGDPGVAAGVRDATADDLSSAVADAAVRLRPRTSPGPANRAAEYGRRSPRPSGAGARPDYVQELLRGLGAELARRRDLASASTRRRGTRTARVPVPPAALERMNMDIDERQILPTIHVPNASVAHRPHRDLAVRAGAADLPERSPERRTTSISLALIPEPLVVPPATRTRSSRRQPVSSRRAVARRDVVTSAGRTRRSRRSCSPTSSARRSTRSSSATRPLEGASWSSHHPAREHPGASSAYRGHELRDRRRRVLSQVSTALRSIAISLRRARSSSRLTRPWRERSTFSASAAYRRVLGTLSGGPAGFRAHSRGRRDQRLDALRPARRAPEAGLVSAPSTGAVPSR